MLIGLPRETRRHEHRVGLNPFAVSRLTEAGHTVLVEKNAGADSHFTDRNFTDVGGQIVYDAEEIYQRSDLMCGVSVRSVDEIERVKPGSILASFQHLAVASRAAVKRLMELETTVIGYELIRDAKDNLPVLYPISEMAGRMAVYTAAHLCQNESGGRGILLGSIPGVAPATVLILGAGTVGRTAAKQALAVGAHVIILDTDLTKLQEINEYLESRAVTIVGGSVRLERYTSFADVVIGAVLVPGARPPLLITEEMVRAMKNGSVIIDASIDQGGCVETSRPTTLGDPVFMAHGVLHYCVPNMTSNIARTASRALASAALPYLVSLAGKGLDTALLEDPGLAEGVLIYRGRLVNQQVGEALGIEAEPIAGLLKGGRE
jgi:alanine dehydrogenase